MPEEPTPAATENAATAGAAPAGTPAPARWMSPGVGGIGLASFLADVGHEVPTALLPSFVTSPLGVPATALGLIEASPTAWPERAGSSAAPWPMTSPATARSRSAATPPPRSSPP